MKCSVKVAKQGSSSYWHVECKPCGWAKNVQLRTAAEMLAERHAAGIADRDAEILRGHAAGIADAELGKRHGLSRQRIGQIVKRRAS